MLKCPSTSGTTLSGVDMKKRKVEPSGMSGVKATYLMKGICLGVEEERDELKKKKVELKRSVARLKIDLLKEGKWMEALKVLQVVEMNNLHAKARSNLEEVVAERDRLGCHLISKRYSEDEVDTIKANNYVEDEENEEIEDVTVGIVDSFDGVSPQSVRENQGDDNKCLVGETEKELVDIHLRIKDLEVQLAKKRDALASLLSLQTELQAAGTQLKIFVDPGQLTELRANLHAEEEKRAELELQLTKDLELQEKELDAERQVRLTTLKRHKDQTTMMHSRLYKIPSGSLLPVATINFQRRLASWEEIGWDQEGSPRMLELIFKEGRMIEYIVELKSYQDGKHTKKLEVVQVHNKAEEKHLYFLCLSNMIEINQIDNSIRSKGRRLPECCDLTPQDKKAKLLPESSNRRLGISFEDCDTSHIKFPHHDALVIMLKMKQFVMHTMMIDTGSGFLDLVKTSWEAAQAGNPIIKLMKKLQRLKIEIKIWRKATTGGLAADISRCSEALENLHTLLEFSDDETLIKEAANIEEELNRAKFIKKNGECINYFKPSSIWPGLKGVMNYVKNNSRWQIGNGYTIDFWRDCWGADLPLMEEVSVESEIWGICSAKLNSIIDQTGWNAPPLVAEFLTDHGFDLRNLDVDCNLNDKRVWRYHPQGAFIVQSVYEAIRSKNPKVWWRKYLHGKPLHQKVKYFLWRACQNVLATEDNVRRRGISIPSRCPLCQQQSESIQHLFWDCDAVAPLWQWLLDLFQISSFPHNMKEMLGLGDKMSMYIKDLWRAAVMNLIQLIRLSQNSVIIKEELGDQVRARPLPRIASCRWTFNCNNSILGNPGKAGLGLIARNHSGDVLGVRTKGLGVLSRPDAKCYAMLEAMSWATEMGWQKIWIEAYYDTTAGSSIQLGSAESLQFCDYDQCKSSPHIKDTT
ncbi:hypothetical protein GIB67_011711 [Kingdonia uniflora]|uniref:Reverse transcriptase zinc-binding domain-containing protein n=1 Tax=Kingdonia uniflora TaxID=39325 RepID=A0A7J7LUH7_9MAGN|nr:hypothetical protein GIB67_011711 [Kingdonia uniflora]